MRKFSLFLLLAATAMPATAQRGDDDDRQSRRAAQAEKSDDRPQRAERAERREAREQRQVERQVQAQAPRSERIERYQQQQAQQGGSSRSERLERYQQQLQGQQQQQASTAPSERLQRYQQRRMEAQGAGGGELMPRQTRIRTIPTTTPQAGQAGPVRSDVRVGTRHYRGDRDRWTSHWRNDRRYDWRRHRDRNRSIFHIGFYYDPFGYSYRRFGIGSFLYPNYYQSNYWINDPWQYRLPPAYGPYRWVRYHDDAILIDTWTGEVVDVIYGFFW